MTFARVYSSPRVQTGQLTDFRVRFLPKELTLVDECGNPRINGAAKEATSNYSLRVILGNCKSHRPDIDNEIGIDIDQNGRVVHAS